MYNTKHSAQTGGRKMVKVVDLTRQVITKGLLRQKLSSVIGDPVANLVVEGTFGEYPEDRRLRSWDMIQLETSLRGLFGVAADTVYELLYMD